MWWVLSCLLSPVSGIREPERIKNRRVVTGRFSYIRNGYSRAKSNSHGNENVRCQRHRASESLPLDHPQYNSQFVEGPTDKADEEFPSAVLQNKRPGRSQITRAPHCCSPLPTPCSSNIIPLTKQNHAPDLMEPICDNLIEINSTG